MKVAVFGPSSNVTTSDIEKAIISSGYNHTEIILDGMQKRGTSAVAAKWCDSNDVNYTRLVPDPKMGDGVSGWDIIAAGIDSAEAVVIIYNGAGGLYPNMISYARSIGRRYFIYPLGEDDEDN